MKKRLFTAVSAVLCAVLIIAATTVSGAAAFYDSAELLEIKTHIEKDAGMSEYATVQGACTDGEYAYFAVQEYATVILKYDLKTWKLKKKATVDGLGHANDMTYNSNRDIIVIANNNAKEDKLTLLDPDTLSPLGTVEPKRAKTAKEKQQDKDDKKDDKPLKVYSIAYQEAQDRYIVGLSGGYNFAVLDKDFKQIKAYKGVDTGYTRQGCDCDDDYIYFPQSGGDNIVVVYDYSGSHVDTVSLHHSHEVENLFHVGDDFYLTLHYYGNSVRRVGLSDDTQIRFGVRFSPAAGTGRMQTVRVHYGEETKLPKCAYRRPGYFFGGWQAKRDYSGAVLGRRLGGTAVEWLDSKDCYDMTLLPDEAKVSKLTRIGNVTLSAFWISEQYEVNFDCGSGEGWMDSEILDYAAAFTLPESRFTRYGYVFVGYTAAREADGRAYGYAAGSQRPQWLKPQDMTEPYLFAQGEEVSRLTYDGAVTFTAQFSLAFLYDEEQRTLLSYIGIDDDVVIPNPSGELHTIASGAFCDNTIITGLTVPETVDVIEQGAVSDCPSLSSVRFTEHFPARFDGEIIIGSGVQKIYLVMDGQPVFLGIYSGGDSGELVRRSALAYELCRAWTVNSAVNPSQRE